MVKDFLKHSDPNRANISLIQKKKRERGQTREGQ